MRIQAVRTYYIYIMTNVARDSFETGVTGDLMLRMETQKQDMDNDRDGEKGKFPFLVYWEECEDAYDALNRESQIRNYSRKKKADLIDKQNPEWKFLNETISNINSPQL